jgi:hypothetical protein
MDVANKQFVEATMGGGGPEHVLRAGDVMTGSLTLPTAIINAPTGGQADLYGQLAGAYRWLIRLTDNFELHRYDDAGAYAGSPLQINRATGNANFVGQVAAGSVWSPSGYLGSFSADNASIGNCNSGGTFSLNAVNCGAFTASTITDYGAMTVQGLATLNGNATAPVFTASNEYQSSRGDSLIVFRAVPGAGVVRFDSRGQIIPDWGFACKPGVSAQARPNTFNIDFNDIQQAKLFIDNTDLGQFAFTSDYRIKKDVTDLPSMWDKVKSLHPISYTQKEYAPLFKDNDVEQWGFIAHELQETLTESAASARKDAPNVIQSPNPWTVIASLTKALQEAMQRIETLEARAGISK